MKWTYGIKNKILASIVLLALCLLVLLNNYLNTIHTKNVKDSIATLYEDRLIAEDYILKMTRSIYQIREVLNADLNTVSKSTAVSKLIAEFNNTYQAYSKTKLTATEKATAIELMGYILKFEQALLNNNYHPTDYTKKTLVSLSQLSNIQLEESKLIMKHVGSQYASLNALSQFAFAIIIIILIVLQVIVFSSGSLIPVVRPNDPTLN